MVRMNQVTERVIGCAMRVHSRLGPGLLESAYEACLAHELRQRGVQIIRQLALPVVYDGLKVDAGYRIDLLVEDVVVVEVKSIEAVTPRAPRPGPVLSSPQRPPRRPAPQLQRHPAPRRHRKVHQ